MLDQSQILFIVNFLTEKELTDFWYLVNTCTWQYGRVSNTFSSQKQSRMTFSFNSEDFIRTDLWKRIKESFKESVSLSKAYINFADPATVNLPHCDGQDNGPSILICLNQEWRRDWGGYTVFFKDMTSSEITKAVVPEPGKAVIFNGSNWHSGMPVAHFAPYPRFILTTHCFIE